MTVTATDSIVEEVKRLLSELGVARDTYTDGDLEVRTPITGEVIARVHTTDAARAQDAISAAHKGLSRLARGSRRRAARELVRLLGEELRTQREALGRLVTIEAGKILSEGGGRGAGDGGHLRLRARGSRASLPGRRCHRSERRTA